MASPACGVPSSPAPDRPASRRRSCSSEGWSTQSTCWVARPSSPSACGSRSCWRCARRRWRGWRWRSPAAGRRCSPPAWPRCSTRSCWSTCPICSRSSRSRAWRCWWDSSCGSPGASTFPRCSAWRLATWSAELARTPPLLALVATVAAFSIVLLVFLGEWRSTVRVAGAMIAGAVVLGGARRAAPPHRQPGHPSGARPEFHRERVVHRPRRTRRTCSPWWPRGRGATHSRWAVAWPAWRGSRGRSCAGRCRWRRSCGIVIAWRRLVSKVLAAAIPVLVILASGWNPPFLPVFEFFHDIVPGYEMFRQPMSKFGVLLVLCLAVALAVGLDEALAALVGHALRTPTTRSRCCPWRCSARWRWRSCTRCTPAPSIAGERDRLPSARVTLPDSWRAAGAAHRRAAGPRRHAGAAVERLVPSRHDLGVPRHRRPGVEVDRAAGVPAAAPGVSGTRRCLARADARGRVGARQRRPAHAARRDAGPGHALPRRAHRHHHPLRHEPRVPRRRIPGGGSTAAGADVGRLVRVRRAVRRAPGGTVLGCHHTGVVVSNGRTDPMEATAVAASVLDDRAVVTDAGPAGTAWVPGPARRGCRCGSNPATTSRAWSAGARPCGVQRSMVAPCAWCRPTRPRWAASRCSTRPRSS